MDYRIGGGFLALESCQDDGHEPLTDYAEDASKISPLSLWMAHRSMSSREISPGGGSSYIVRVAPKAVGVPSCPEPLLPFLAVP